MVHLRLNPHNLTMAIGQRITVASYLAGWARFRWPFRVSGGWQRSCSNYSTESRGHPPPPPPSSSPSRRVAAVFRSRKDATLRDDNREVGGQTIVYLRVSPRCPASHYVVARVHQLFRHRSDRRRSPALDELSRESVISFSIDDPLSLRCL